MVLSSIDDVVMPALRRALPTDFALFVVPTLPRRVGTDKVDRKRLMHLVDYDVSLHHGKCEVELCDSEVESLMYWYLPLVLLVAAFILC